MCPILILYLYCLQLIYVHFPFARRSQSAALDNQSTSMDQILDKCMLFGKMPLYLFKFGDEPVSQAQWIPLDGLENEALIQQFEQDLARDVVSKPPADAPPPPSGATSLIGVKQPPQPPKPSPRPPVPWPSAFSAPAPSKTSAPISPSTSTSASQAQTKQQTQQQPKQQPKPQPKQQPSVFTFAPSASADVPKKSASASASPSVSASVKPSPRKTAAKPQAAAAPKPQVQAKPKAKQKQHHKNNVLKSPQNPASRMSAAAFNTELNRMLDWQEDGKTYSVNVERCLRLLSHPLSVLSLSQRAELISEVLQKVQQSDISAFNKCASFCLCLCFSVCAVCVCLSAPSHTLCE